MIRFDIISAVPALLSGPLDYSIVKRAKEKSLVDIYIHDCEVWNQDDCFTIVPTSKNGINAKCTENIVVENVKASGLGLTVGSVRILSS